MYTEICAELGEAIAAVSSTQGIQFHRILSLLGEHDQWPVEKGLLNRRTDLNKGPSYFRPPAVCSDRTPTAIAVCVATGMVVPEGGWR